MLLKVDGYEADELLEGIYFIVELKKTKFKFSEISKVLKIELDSLGSASARWQKLNHVFMIGAVLTYVAQLLLELRNDVGEIDFNDKETYETLLDYYVTHVTPAPECIHFMY